MQKEGALPDKVVVSWELGVVVDVNLVNGPWLIEPQ